MIVAAIAAIRFVKVGLARKIINYPEICTRFFAIQHFLEAVAFVKAYAAIVVRFNKQPYLPDMLSLFGIVYAKLKVITKNVTVRKGLTLFRVSL